MYEVSELLGRIITSIDVDKEKYYIDFIMDDGDVYRMTHFQSCCEDVRVKIFVVIG